MILGQTMTDLTQADDGERTTLDDLFRRAGVRRPDAPALIDPPNRRSFTDGAPRRLTFAEADRMVSAIAGRLRRLNLPQDSIVAIQLPSTVENVLTLLGVLRAGLIASPLPLLWRRADMVAALSLIGAKALITCARAGDVDHCELAMTVAADVFPIRYVCAFGDDIPDGIVPLNDLYTIDQPDQLPPVERATNPATHVAVITWDIDADGPVPVARSHGELIAGGVAVHNESRIEPDAEILSTFAFSSFAGLSLSVVPWLLAGGTLVLHQPFDPAVLAAQRAQHPCSAIIVPGPLVVRLADAGLLDGRDSLKTVIAAWRGPERVEVSPNWNKADVALVDAYLFGEAGLAPVRRHAGGQPVSLAIGPLTAPRATPHGVLVAELGRTEAGRFAMRGPMVPRHPFPPGIERTGAPCFKVGEDGFVDTGYTCRLDRDSGALMVTRPPTGVISVGGYRFLLRELHTLLARLEPIGTLTALPDALGGHRLAGSAADRAAVQRELEALGINPLVAGAFRERRAADQPPSVHASAA
jgi:non-ribosomal peptide synthetase component E (peptide arylation enzyme)